MEIKLTKAAQWNGKHHRAGSKHDVSKAIADKLLRRGLAAKVDAKTEAEEKVEDGTAAE